MIKVNVIKRDGFIQITAHHHAKSEVCAAVSMILQAASLGLRDLAKQYPSEVRYENDIEDNAKESALDSTDQRRRSER